MPELTLDEKQFLLQMLRQARLAGDFETMSKTVATIQAIIIKLSYAPSADTPEMNVTPQPEGVRNNGQD